MRLAITAPHTNPVTRDFATTERAACAFPAPSLFATRTLKTPPPDSLTQTLSFGTREACSFFPSLKPLPLEIKYLQQITCLQRREQGKSCLMASAAPNCKNQSH
jgi:hypothetical protein